MWNNHYWEQFTCIIQQTWQWQHELQPNEGDQHVGLHSLRWLSCQNDEQQNISYTQTCRDTNTDSFLSTTERHYCHPVEKTELCMCSVLICRCVQLYLQSVQRVADTSVSASVCRIGGILCSWPGCGGAAHTKWTTPPASINTPSHRQSHCHLAQDPKSSHTRPLGQLLTNTALPHTPTKPRTQPGTQKRTLVVRQMYMGGDWSTHQHTQCAHLDIHP